MVELEAAGVSSQPSFVAFLWPSVLLLWPLYVVVLVVCRLYLSPIAHIPGPRLAAVTWWYEAYYEIVLSGRYSFHIDKLHDIYGSSFSSIYLSDKSVTKKGPD